jgi:hypothetical protein
VLILKRPWAQQPQTYAAPAVGKAISFLWTPSLGLLSPVLGDVLSNTGPVTLKTSSYGVTADMASGAYLRGPSNKPQIVTSNGAGTGDFSILTLCRLPYSSATFNRALASQRSNTSATFNQATIQGNANSAGAVTAGSLHFSTYSTAYTAVAATVAHGVWAVVGMSRIGSLISGYYNGALVATVSGTARSIVAADSQFGIGVAPPNFSGVETLESALVACMNRGMTDVEMREAYNNVWRYCFAPRTRYFPTTSAAAAVPTLSASTYVTGSLTSTGWRPQITAS